MQIPPDRIVAGTYICAAAATRGTIIIDNPPEGETGCISESVRENGWTI